jgi:DNA replication protein DnaC
MKAIEKVLTGKLLTQEDFNLMIKNCLSKIENPTELDEMEHQNTILGGLCCYCDKPWIAKKCPENVGSYKYFVPGCNCIDKKRNLKNLAVVEKKIAIASEVPSRYQDCKIKNMDRQVIDQDTDIAIGKVEKYLKEGLYRNKGLILYGDIGAGKTHLAVSVMKYVAVKENKKALFVHGSDLISNMIKSTDDYSKRIMSKDIILIDDIDKLNAGRDSDSAWVAERFFSLINGLTSNNKMIIATSNLDDINEFAKKYDTAIISRLLEACLFLKVVGKDMRMERNKL